ncbi:hypothetical protein BC749_104267 [Flavobacterium araucananum]|nr:hypothetical protein BC749_104267 [Flavobacterium araucananum]
MFKEDELLLCYSNERHPLISAIANSKDKKDSGNYCLKKSQLLYFFKILDKYKK